MALGTEHKKKFKKIPKSIVSQVFFTQIIDRKGLKYTFSGRITYLLQQTKTKTKQKSKKQVGQTLFFQKSGIILGLFTNKNFGNFRFEFFETLQKFALRSGRASCG